MEHYKQFLLRLQTFNIKLLNHRDLDKKVAADSYAVIPRYDLSHENPDLNHSFKSSIKELKELAVTDILNLAPEQITSQLRRLKDTKELFRQFWKNYSNSPFPIGTPDLAGFFATLRLGELFIVPGIVLDGPVEVSEQFLDDLCDSIRAREAYMRDFENTIARLVPDEENTAPTVPEGENTAPSVPGEESTVTPPSSSAVIGGIPIFKQEITGDLYDLFKDFFWQEEQEPLKQLFQTGDCEKKPLTFLENGNQLADAFRQLYDSRVIVGCNKAQLERWILQHFQYLNQNEARPFTAKYLNDHISTDTKTCKSPLLNVKNTADGGIRLVPLTRNKKDYNN